MEAKCSSETLSGFQWTTRRHIPENITLHVLVSLGITEIMLKFFLCVIKHRTLKMCAGVELQLHAFSNSAPGTVDPVIKEKRQPVTV
jgi:hypothetical protein